MYNIVVIEGKRELYRELNDNGKNIIKILFYFFHNNFFKKDKLSPAKGYNILSIFNYTYFIHEQRIVFLVGGVGLGTLWSRLS